MRKILLVAAGAAALAASACGLAQAQNGAGANDADRHGILQSDADNDGVLTRAEFDAGRTAQFTRLDADSNSQVTREEMRAGRGDRGEDGHRGGRGHRGGGRGGPGFAGADANNDGNITRDEFLARPTEMFNRLDANHDGVIQASERPQRQAQDGERRQHVDRPNPDTNGDGSFSRVEFTAMGAGVFERFDANNDGRVTQEEAQAAHGHHRRGRD